LVQNLNVIQIDVLSLFVSAIRMSLIDSLERCFSGRSLTSDEDKAPYLTDWRGKWAGKAFAVAQPDTAQDVANVVRWCVINGFAIVPQGGNTGMSGAATPDDRGTSVVISLARLNRVRDINPMNNTMTVEAGCILQSLQTLAEEHDRLFPLSLSAEGSCMIGGNLATNAGGVGVLRYGNTRELCLGLEVVTAEGEIWNGLRGLRKDNSGYDLRDLFIGSEGTLGIITAATLKLFSLPKATLCAWVAVNTVDNALELLQLAQGHAGAKLTAFELMSHACVELLQESFVPTRWPLSEKSDWYVLIEVSDLVSETEANATLETLLEAAMDRSLAIDAAIAINLSQTRDFWVLRENMGEAQVRAGKNIKHDISVPISKFPIFIRETNAKVIATAPEARMIVFGHLGDGNLHYNVSPHPGQRGETFSIIEPAINRIVHDAVDAVGGSISAEHGLGVLRAAEARRYKSDVELKLQRAIKQALDPRGLMNPGKGIVG
jgi:FAD/FMN-containing dehydrogenase